MRHSSPRPLASAALGHSLPRLQPEDPAARLLLFGIRQLGANGLNDAAAAHAFVTAFGTGFRRPLLLLRTLMAEMSAASAGPIQIAPWCCARMTASEGALLDLIAQAERDSERARFLLSDLLGIRRVDGVLATAHALANAFADAGLPVEV
ncbi:hypothetical protein FPZ54_05230 [Sphingomonas suaedae]|uniref:Uncharacterized protein n=1 Tax=Sphingomonas suaedae TaxID=2599297 RepID=A0A518RDF8_9SPHN|nr:DUF6628 family protein [Sphingomonas suaedae]QDX25483.1 hypothetical protein FPZ54_05230 [Sphingomonas suaedae]